jgi:hypothetical protein
MPRWFEEFFLVTEASRRLRIALLAIPALPSLIVLFGASQLNSGASPGQYSGLVAAARDGALYLYLAIVLFACIGCVRIAGKQYRRVRKQLFGTP